MIRVLGGVLAAALGMALATVCGLWAQTGIAEQCRHCSRALFFADLFVALIVLPGAVALLAVVWVLAGARTARPGLFTASLGGLGLLWIVGGCLTIVVAGLVGGWFHAVGAVLALAWFVALVFTVRRFDAAEVDLGGLARLDL